jgi:hypothetical protein
METKFIKLPSEVSAQIELEVQKTFDRISYVSFAISERHWMNELKEEKAINWFREQELLLQIEQLKRQIT